MSVPTYDSYRDSGVDGLGRVPSHWSVAPAKYAMTARSGGASIKGECADSPDDGLYQGYSASGPNVWLPDFEYDGPGLVLSAVGARCGKVFKADGKWGVVANTHCLIPREGSCRDFLWYLTNDESWWEKGGTAQPFVKVPDSLVRKIALPTVGEQVAIARFLDRETAKIDTLVAEQERLIALLKEKRQAVISHAVTKGLNPDAPMKDSGIEWLGEVPAHWEVKPLKYVGKFNAGAGFPHEDQGVEGEALSFHKVNALGKAGSDGVLLPSEDTVSYETAARLRAFVFPADSIVFAKIGAALLLGRIRQLGAAACLDNNMMGLVVNEHNCPAFVCAVMTLLRFDFISNPGTVPSLNESQIANVAFAMPPLAEQQDIAVIISEESQKFDALSGNCTKAIELLQERRAALISAAVTGKIDVRGSVEVRTELEVA